MPKKKAAPKKKSWFTSISAPKITGAGSRRDKKLLDAEKKALGIK